MSEFKTLLLQAPITMKKQDAKTFGIFVPLGLLAVGTMLVENGFNVEILDLLAEAPRVRTASCQGYVEMGMPGTDIEKILLRRNPNIIGITNNFTAFSDDCIRLAEIVRQCIPKAIIVMGGAHASVETESILESGVVDAVVIGEGEYSFSELVGALEKGNEEQAHMVSGTAWNINGKLVYNKYPGPIENLDKLPRSDYRLLGMDRYIWQKNANFAAAMRWPIGHMLTSRGCVYNCRFCSVTNRFKRYRTRSIENVIAEMELLINHYGIQEFHFHDDCFMAKPDRIVTFCNRIIEKKMNIRWQISQGVNSVGLDENLLKLMYDSGMYRIGFPVESASQDVLRLIRKPVNLNKIKGLIKTCNHLGIYTFGCFMIGFPEETKAQVEETIRFINESGLDYIKVSVVQPIPGSKLFEDYEKNGLLNDGIKHGSTYFHSEYDTVHMTADQLNTIRIKILRKFSIKRITRMFLSGGIQRYLLPKLRTKDNAKYFLRMIWQVLCGM